jgi:GNAT superfamily N-acetyltransferase
MTVTRLRSRDEVVEAAGDTPYTRMMTSRDGPTTGVATPDGVAWRSVGPWGPLTCVLGTEAALDALGGPVSGYLHLSAPSGRPDLPLREVWEFRWLAGPPVAGPPATSGEPVRLAVEDHRDVDALLDEAFPSTSSRPGDPWTGAWWGIRDATGRLVACGAERAHNGIGYLSAITVATDRRGLGLAAALTAAMTADLHARHGAVTLGVNVRNTRAIELYERLGFTRRLLRHEYLI